MYVRGPGGDLVKELRMFDHLGSVRVRMKTTGNETVDYNPYGENRTGTTTARTTYIDKEKDAENKNRTSDFSARKYEEKTGRFMRPDPLWGLTPGVSSYVYGNASPVVFSDPRGLSTTSYFPNTPVEPTEPYGPPKPDGLPECGSSDGATGGGATPATQGYTGPNADWVGIQFENTAEFGISLGASNTTYNDGNSSSGGGGGISTGKSAPTTAKNNNNLTKTPNVQNVNSSSSPFKFVGMSPNEQKSIEQMMNRTEVGRRLLELIQLRAKEPIIVTFTKSKVNRGSINKISLNRELFTNPLSLIIAISVVVHEMTHVFDALYPNQFLNNGPSTILPEVGKVNLFWEFHAVEIENQARKELGLPMRNNYQGVRLPRKWGVGLPPIVPDIIIK